MRKVFSSGWIEPFLRAKATHFAESRKLSSPKVPCRRHEGVVI